MPTERSLEVACLAATVIADKKGEEVRVLDMRQVTLVADYFVLASGRTTVQINALAEHVEAALKTIGVTELHRVGGSRSHWLLQDYGEVVIHLFTEEERHYYDLERLWGDAEVVNWESLQTELPPTVLEGKGSTL